VKPIAANASMVSSDGNHIFLDFAYVRHERASAGSEKQDWEEGEDFSAEMASTAIEPHTTIAIDMENAGALLMNLHHVMTQLIGEGNDDLSF